MLVFFAVDMLSFNLLAFVTQALKKSSENRLMLTQILLILQILERLIGDVKNNLHLD
ncbi:hypothetical protein GCM10007852_26620 [Agaribacter marinus]|uniref:Uncharacterized protein n=1 Tax=Agaribacter marinus TaxID=1431249 RepID=A0AA37T0P3_9ALTE|nr:hypothetical protein GCM10007852_26620 [Agaribacter marinus]